MSAPDRPAVCWTCRRAIALASLLILSWTIICLVVGFSVYVSDFARGDNWVPRVAVFILAFVAWLGVSVLFFNLSFKLNAHSHTPAAPALQASVVPPDPVGRSLPTFSYQCPACPRIFHQPGLCPVDFVELVEVDPVEDHFSEEL